MIETISTTEVIRAAFCLWGAAHHWRAWRRLQSDISLLDAGLVPISASGMVMFRSDADAEADKAAVMLGLTMLAVIAMSEPSPPLTVGSALRAAVWVSIVVGARVRSEMRARRREREIHRESEVLA